MTQDEFHDLVHLVLQTKEKPPEKLFLGGMDDWHSRARLAHFLSMPEINKTNEALELFLSIVETDIEEEKSEDVEEKVFALQKLSKLELSLQEQQNALQHINQAIELAEANDYLYKYILRGELWADRWMLLHAVGNSSEAEKEADERIAAYQEIPNLHNSYIYYGYRFKAQLAAERGTTLIAKDFMHMALHAMDIPASYKPELTKAFSAKHDNAAWILNNIDHATPSPLALNWDI